MAHFIENFSSVLSGPACPVAVDDIRKRVRYPKDENFKGCDVDALILALVDIKRWQDYPESHHVN